MNRREAVKAIALGGLIGQSARAQFAPHDEPPGLQTDRPQIIIKDQVFDQGEGRLWRWFQDPNVSFLRCDFYPLGVREVVAGIQRHKFNNCLFINTSLTYTPWVDVKLTTQCWSIFWPNPQPWMMPVQGSDFLRRFERFVKAQQAK